MSGIPGVRVAIDRHPMLMDAAITAILMGLALLEQWLFRSTEDPEWTPVTVALTVAMILPLVWRRRYPLAALLASTVPLAGYVMTNMEPSSWSVTALQVALYSAGVYGKRGRDLVRALCVAVFFILLLNELFDSDLSDFTGDVSLLRALSVMSNLVIVVATWWFGDSVRTRRERELELAERTAQLELEREESARRAVFDERVRIARELHDVVAHHVSVMGIQAGAARRVLSRQMDRSEKVEAVLMGIEASSREAVQELHRLLGFLRRAEETESLAPQPSLRQLDDLVARMRESGLPVAVSIEGEERPLSPGVDLSAYRIVQEALTNVLRHAGKATASVVVRYGVDAVDIEVIDDGRESGELPALGQGGNGLIGMRERVSLLGGTLSVGRHPGVGFSVRAHLPLNQVAT